MKVVPWAILWFGTTSYLAIGVSANTVVGNKAKNNIIDGRYTPNVDLWIRMLKRPYTFGLIASLSDLSY